MATEAVLDSGDVRDLTDRDCCAVCGRVTPPAKGRVYWVCSRCRKEHALPAKFKDWPGWAKFLANDEQQRRRRISSYLESKMDIISLDELEAEEEAGLDKGDADDC